VAAAKLGFQMFAGNFVGHLKTSLVEWLTGALRGAGLYIPQALSLVEIGKFVLSVLGITWPKIRTMIVKALGPKGEMIMKALETGFDIVVALVKGGPAAAWEVIKDKLGNLRDMVISAIISFVEEKIVKAAVTKLLSMLSPVGAFIQAIISIYNTVMFFVERLATIAKVVAAFIDSIAAIASGAIGAAAARVEAVLGGLLTLVISFLARLVGLGGVTDFIVGKIQALQESVHQALEAGVTFLINKAKAFIASIIAKVTGKGKDKDKPDDRTEDQKKADLAAAAHEVQVLAKQDDATPETVQTKLPAIRAKFRLTDLSVVHDGPDKMHVHASINPELNEPLPLTDVGPLEDKLRSLGFFGSAPGDIKKISKGLTGSGSGNAVGAFIMSGKFDRIPGYNKSLLQIKNKSQIPAVYMAMSKADELLSAGTSKLHFEPTPPGPNVDVDLAVVAVDGSWATVFQFKRITGTLEELVAKAHGYAESQLDSAPATTKWMIISVPTWNKSDYDALPPAKKFDVFRTVHPTVNLKVTFKDGATIVL
jgi:hypothetical protein